VSEKNRVKIPLLTLVPVPYLSIDEAEIDFSAKIVATSKQQKGKFVPLYASTHQKLKQRQTSTESLTSR